MNVRPRWNRIPLIKACLIPAIALALGLSLSVPVAHGQTSPAGSWDVVLGGRYQSGLAQIQFLPDGTLSGLAVFTIQGNHFTHTNGSYVYRHILGAAAVQGEWVQAGPKQIRGYLNLVGTNESGAITNGFSLDGIVRPNRLTLLAQGPAGKVNLRGIPLVQTNLADMAATNYVSRVVLRRVPFPLFEIFSAAQLAANIYDLAGGGPGYDFTGTLLISRQRQAALYQHRSAEAEGSALAAYSGPFNLSRRRGTLKGSDGVNLGMRYRFEPGAP